MEGNVGRVLAITNSNSVIQGARKKTIGREIIIGPTAIKFVTIAIFAILAMIYLAQSTAGANRSVKIRNLDEQSSQLLLEKERLEVEQTRLKSLKEIDNGTEKNVMEPVTTIEKL